MALEVHAVTRRGGLKPHLEDVADIHEKLMLTDPGRLLIFNKGTLHGGAVNRRDETRVSTEMRMVFSGS